MTSPGCLLAPSQCRYFARILLRLLFCLAPAFAGTAFAQEPDLDNLAKQISKTLQEAHIRTVIVSDFAGNGGRATLQGVYLADRLWFALLEEQKDFQTLNRNLLQKRLYSQQLTAGESFGKSELDAAHAAGAEVLITGKIEQQPKNLSINITALNVSTGQKLEQRTYEVPRSKSLDGLALQPIQADGPVYLVGQNGVGTPACVYCPDPQYSEEARKKKLEGKVVLTLIIGPTGRAEKIWEVRGLSDGLTEQAIEVVREWRFKPAQDAKGNAVTVMVPVDVTFRLM